MVNRISKILWGVFLFTFPFSVRWLVYENAAYRFGNFNPWVSGFVYGPEVLLWAAFVLWAVGKVRAGEKIFSFQKESLWPLAILGLFVLNALLVSGMNGDPVLALFFLLRVLEGGMVVLLLGAEVLPVKRVVTLLLFALAAQVAWGAAQVYFNHSLGLTWLGEGVLGPDVPGVAKIDFASGLKQIRAYGSFLHPNILGAYCVTILLLAMSHLKHSSKFFWIMVTALGVYLTHSRAAMGVGAAALGLYFLLHHVRSVGTRKTFAFLFFIVLILGNAWFFTQGTESIAAPIADASLSERVTQTKISRAMHVDQPAGVGVGQFTLEMEKYWPEKLKPWDFQPVHNTYFLILNETGVQGLILLLSLILILTLQASSPALTSFALLALLAPFDHFLWDSFSGMMLIALTIGFAKIPRE